jgi:Holliday junction DNA helicase RuvB
MCKREINDVQPTSLSHIIANAGVTTQVRVAMDAAFEDNHRFPHALMVGPPGMGKSTMASVVAQEMAVPFHEVLGQNLRNAGDLNSLLLQAEPKAIVHIDEVHEASTAIQTALYMALDKRQIMTRSGAAIIALPINDFTLLLSTTEEHDLLQPLRDRMRLTLRFDFYTELDLYQVVFTRAKGLGWDIDDVIPSLIASRGRGTPRIALKLLQAARRCCRAAGESLITVTHLQQACELETIDRLGLGFIEQKYLNLLVDGPRRVNVIASALGIPAKTLTSVQEPLLIRLGLIDKDDVSRRYLTSKGREHLFRTIADESPDGSDFGF